MPRSPRLGRPSKDDLPPEPNPSADFFSAAATSLRDSMQDSLGGLLPAGRPPRRQPPPRAPLPDLPEGESYSRRDWRKIIAEERLRRHWERYLLDYTPRGHPLSASARRANRLRESKRCADNPIYWIERYLWMEDPHARKSEDRIFPVVIWPAQRRFLAFLLDSLEYEWDEAIADKGRKVGATWLCVSLIYHRWNWEKSFRAKLGCYSEGMVDDGSTDSLFGKFRFIWDKQPEWLRPDLVDRVHVKHLQITHPTNGSIISGGAASPNFGRGSRQTVILTDEWAHYDPTIQQKIKLSLESVASTWWKISTPNGRGDDFHASYVLADPDRKILINWTADPRRTKEWYDGLLRENGGKLTFDQREQEHGGNFAAVLGHRIWSAKREHVEYTDEDLADEMDEEDLVELPLAASMDFGSGPSLTVFGVAYIDFDTRGRPRFWIDLVDAWQRTSASSIGQSIIRTIEGYGGRVQVFGDPAGRQVDSNQESWESNLRSVGVPILCLDAEYNTDYFIRESITEVQTAFDEGRIRIHKQRSALLLEVVESWQWDTRGNVPLEMLNKSSIKPRKDQWSHGGDMLRYLVSKVLRDGVADRGSIPRIDPTMIRALPGADLAAVYGRVFAPGSMHGEEGGEEGEGGGLRSLERLGFDDGIYEGTGGEIGGGDEGPGGLGGGGGFLM